MAERWAVSVGGGRCVALSFCSSRALPFPSLLGVWELPLFYDAWKPLGPEDHLGDV